MNIGERKNAFTLIELIVTISIISLLLTVLLPTLSVVRRTARQTVCVANLYGIMQSVITYTAENGYYPPAYLKNSQTGKVTHFSNILIKDYSGNENNYHCPSLMNMGLPPMNTTSDNLEPDQILPNPETIDNQPKRCSYTANQVLFPEDKFTTKKDGVKSPSKYVADSLVKSASTTIAITEWNSNWLFVEKDQACHSYLPVHGYCGIGTGMTNRYDLNLVDQSSYKSCMYGGSFRQVYSSAISSSPRPERIKPSRLDWVGRNHGPDNELSNFAYADGHVSSTEIFETVDVFQWGKMIYSISGGNKIARPRY